MEVLARALCDIARKLYELNLGRSEVLGVGLELVGVVGTRVVVEVYRAVVYVVVVERSTMAALPQVMLVVAKELLALLEIFVVYPQAAIRAVDSRPNTIAAEEVVAVQLAAVGAIVLVPLEV